MKDWKEIVKACVNDNTEFTMNVNEDEFEFALISPAGQDFRFELCGIETFDDLLKKLDDYYDSYDPSEEASYWLGSDGHGKNGAPYEMGDVYEDMFECKEYVEDLIDYLDDFEFDEYETRVFQIEVHETYTETFYVMADSYDEAEEKAKKLIEEDRVIVNKGQAPRISCYVEDEMPIEEAEEDGIEYFE